MTELELDALLLFKDYTHLQLKSYQIEVQKKYRGPGGAMEPYELTVISQALYYHSKYLSKKLSEK